MGNRAKRQLALTIAAAFALAALTFKPLYACDSKSCPSNTSSLDGVAANALPTYSEPTEEAASEPVKLKRFTRSQTRSARRAQSRKAVLAQRAARKAKQVEQDEDETPVRTKTATKMASGLVNAKAEFIETDAAKAPAATLSEQPKPAATEVWPATAQPPAVETVSADEFNDLDRVAWEANQMPKLMKLTSSDSRAEMRDDDSKWAQTSTIGKLFVAFGALLTFGSAIRMFMA